MQYAETLSATIENVGALDRFHRVLVGTTLIIVAALFSAIPAGAAFSLVAFGIYAGITGAIGWDPMYAFVKALHQRTTVPTPETLTAYQRHEEPAAADNYKKAA
jgi:Inner membrane protein YgaP-like, transmembrane domain